MTPSTRHVASSRKTPTVEVNDSMNFMASPVSENESTAAIGLERSAKMAQHG
jgi:hypothetical protein